MLYTLLLGTNIGDKKANITNCISQLNKTLGKTIKQSSIYESEAWGYKSNNKFYNAAIIIESNILPVNTLKIIKQIEKTFGRTKNNKLVYEDRIIDIDILFCENITIYTNNLQIPHPKLHLRKFTLKPLIEINKNFIHPLLNKSIEELDNECKDSSEVNSVY